MKLHTSMFLACSMLILLSSTPAIGQTAIPEDVSQQMVKGKNLNLVWKASDFEGTKGLRIGRTLDDTEDGNAGPVLEYVSMAMQKLIKADSPYLLDLFIIGLQMKESPSGRATARLQVEGRIVDGTGKIKAAFTASSSDSSTGNAKDNARLALRVIAFGMTKDLFTTDLLKTENRSAIIVPAGTPDVPAPNDPARTVAAKQAAAPAAPHAPAVKPASSVPTPPTVSEPPMVSAPSGAKPLPAVAAVPSPLFDAATAANMKRGKGLAQVWTSPAYDRTAGFALGEVRYETELRNDGVDQYLPEALTEISRPDAPCTLQLRVVSLGIRNSGNSGTSFVSLRVKGSITRADGTLLAAFETLENVAGVGDSVADCRTAARRVVLAIIKDLK